MATMFQGVEYDDRHGGPFDRGSADSYYGRRFRPHYFEGSTGKGPEIIPERGSKEWDEYTAGFDYNESIGNYKGY
jgi:hypothetical protein